MPFAGDRTRLNFDIYNALNSSTVLTQNNSFGPAWQSPTLIIWGISNDFPRPFLQPGMIEYVASAFRRTVEQKFR